VTPRRRDAALAAAALLGLLAVAAALGVPPAALLDPVPAALGAAGALALELPFYLAPERAHRLWYRPGVGAGATLAVVLAGGALATLAGVRTITALLAGLLTYFFLLGLTVAGVLPSAGEGTGSGRSGRSPSPARGLTVRRPTGRPMAREVTHTADGPLYLDEDDIDPERGDIAVCLCGLSDEYPFCDGSHRAVQDEPEGGRYKYVDGERREIASIEYVGDGEHDPNGADGTGAAETSESESESGGN
jgi:CDGSH-type Zn-finger protein